MGIYVYIAKKSKRKKIEINGKLETVYLAPYAGKPSMSWYSEFEERLRRKEERAMKIFQDFTEPIFILCADDFKEGGSIVRSDSPVVYDHFEHVEYIMYYNPKGEKNV